MRARASEWRWKILDRCVAELLGSPWAGARGAEAPGTALFTGGGGQASLDAWSAAPHLLCCEARGELAAAVWVA